MSDVLFQGSALQLRTLDDGLAELSFDRAGEAVNKLDRLTLDEVAQAVRIVRETPSIRGLLLTSGKDAFIVGADIFEFTAVFAMGEADLAAYNAGQSAVMTALDDLPVPTVAAIGGLALGGGLELALAADERMLASDAQVGLPEVGLGIFPGFGGTVRLPRLAGLEQAAAWILSGTPRKADAALQAGVADAVVAAADLRGAALERLRAAASGATDWRTRRLERRGPVRTTAEQAAPVLEAAKAAARKAGPHLPAGPAAIDLLEATYALDRDAALREEARAFARIARTPAAAALVQIFINDQAVKKAAKRHAKAARPVTHAAVLGAGIMGGGIAYQSAVRGIPVTMKDISQAALDLGMGEARKQLDKLVETGRLTAAKADAILASITPTLSYDGVAQADVVVEAVVENIKVKHAVFGEIEGILRPDAVIATNTSSLLVADLAPGLKRQDRFVGMHFFNPVPRMPLVEIIQGPATTAEAVATLVGYASAMGKTPVVVQDCPGFLVNRILTPYVLGFLRLVHDGADLFQVDAAMEAFGWPMGPAYLLDVIGLDTARHVVEIISGGYGERMVPTFPNAIAVLADAGRYGQKNGAGFYRYETDAKGRQRKLLDPETATLLAAVRSPVGGSFTDEEIVARMMVPMVLEAARCLEDGIVGSAAEVDMSLILGIGFPRHLGGAIHYGDRLGVGAVLDLCDRYEALGGIYRPTERMRALGRTGQSWSTLAKDA